MTYTLRKAVPSDRDHIYALKKESVKPYVEKIWGWDDAFQIAEFDNDFSDIDQFEIIEAENRFIGFLQCNTDEKCITICEIHLLPEVRGNGIGSAIIKQIMRDSVKEKKTVFLGCFKENQKAKELYMRLGFLEVGENETHFLLQYSE